MFLSIFYDKMLLIKIVKCQKNMENLQKKQNKEEIMDFLKTVIVSAGIMLFVRFFIIQPFVVKGSSMEPNFYEKDYLIVDEITYRFKEPQRGDIIVFKYKDENKSEYLIKRIVGLPGDTVIIRDGKVFINNNLGELVLEEPYLPIDRETMGNLSEEIKENNYFVLGDNRAVSLDSRYFGQINKDTIVGKTLLRGFPFNKFGILKMGNPELKTKN